MQHKAAIIQVDRLSWFEKHSGKEMATVFARGAQTMNTMFFKPAGRKAFHKKSTSADMIRETMKFEGDEMKNKSHKGMGSEYDGNISWVPHERTGIYYPKGQEKVMNEISPAAGRDMGVNWFT
ncbi:hypothetical protein ACLB2K_055678 [Fragaria x ananassa]